MFNHLDLVFSIKEIKAGQLLVIQRKRDSKRILVRCRSITNENEVLLSVKMNDYFNFDMHIKGESWVWRVWALPIDIEITNITNNLNKFPR